MSAAVPGVVRQRVEDDRREQGVRRGGGRGPRQVQHLDRGRQAHHMCSQECCSGEDSQRINQYPLFNQVEDSLRLKTSSLIRKAE